MRELETKHLKLRKFQISDAKEMYSTWASNCETTKYLNWNPHKNVEETEEVISKWVLQYEQSNFYLWAIILKEENRLIGCVQAVEEIYSKASLGYCLGKKYWNHGYMTEAVQRVIEYLFLEVGFKTIVAKHHIDNTSSGRVMQKCQMTFIGSSFKINSSGEEIQYMNYQIKREFEIHTMRLYGNAFDAIASKSKTIEIRLNDEKRSKIHHSDVIRFIHVECKKELYTRVIEVVKFPDFKALYDTYSKEELGYEQQEEKHPEDMYTYYSKDNEKKYGVLAIKIELIYVVKHNLDLT